jgi:8-hydroxy-5-deazaflavin:NADPH oxidoreductase
MTPRKIGILGNGNGGSALARGLERAGHDVRAVGSDKAAMRDTAAWASIAILAVPFGAIDGVVKEPVPPSQARRSSTSPTRSTTT